VMPHITCMRRGGAAALDLAMVASGRLDGFWERHLAPWDVLAGVLLIEEAGGRVTAIDGGPLDPVDASLIVGNPVVHKGLLGLLR
jgi:myo-inositol-1(or 4)-monophosphatase